MAVSSMQLLAVSYGFGTNSTAMLCAMKERGIVPDLILAADTGAEMPHSYAMLQTMKTKVREWWGVEIVVVRKMMAGSFEGLEGECMRGHKLPAICRHGLPQPGKSACYFCPAMKRSEVIRLKDEHPELLERALEIERRSQKTNRTNRGLGGEGNKWSDWLAMDAAQAKLLLDIEPNEVPCACMDG